MAGYLFIVSMDVAPDKEALFNEVYAEHIGYLSKVPGVRRVMRAKTEPAAVMIGGEKKPLTGDGEPAYTAIYELDSPDILMSQAWKKTSASRPLGQGGAAPHHQPPAPPAQGGVTP
jgi:hypothetical protein